MKTSEYEIGGLSVRMTGEQASRWNAGSTTEHDLDTVTVSVPLPQNQSRQISLRRATSERLSPELACSMFGMPANPMGRQTRNQVECMHGVHGGESAGCEKCIASLADDHESAKAETSGESAYGLED